MVHKFNDKDTLYTEVANMLLNKVKVLFSIIHFFLQLRHVIRLKENKYC